jgi:hypothetical protein
MGYKKMTTKDCTNYIAYMELSTTSGNEFPFLFSPCTLSSLKWNLDFRTPKED